MLHTIIRQVRVLTYMKDLYNNILDYRKDNLYGSQEILLCLKIGQPTNHPTMQEDLVKTVFIYGVQVVPLLLPVVGMMHHARPQEMTQEMNFGIGLFVNKNKRYGTIHILCQHIFELFLNISA